MARKKSFIGTVLVLGGIAAAGAAIYNKKDEIKAFFKDMKVSFPPADEADWEQEPEQESEQKPEETDIVIDQTTIPAEDTADSVMPEIIETKETEQ